MTRLRSKLRETELQLHKLIEQVQFFNKGFIETTDQSFNNEANCVNCVENMDDDYSNIQENNVQNINRTVIMNNQMNIQTNQTDKVGICSHD